MILRTPTVQATGEWRLTGRMVLLMLIGFFGLITAVNVVMIRAAITTFGGVDTPSSYQAGLTYKAEEAAAAEQNARHWSVDAHLTAGRGGAEVVTIDILDQAGVPVTNAEVSARLAHPVDERRDVAFAMTEIGTGTYSGTAYADAGQWFLDIIVKKNGERMFRSQNRVVIGMR